MRVLRKRAIGSTISLFLKITITAIPIRYTAEIIINDQTGLSTGTKSKLTAIVMNTKAIKLKNKINEQNAIAESIRVSFSVMPKRRSSIIKLM